MSTALPLKTARVNRRLSQEQLAYIAGVTNVTISNIENGQCQPHQKTREKIEAIVGPVDWKLTFDQGQARRRILMN